jgi:CBS domain containing-hemolysin-like protein
MSLLAICALLVVYTLASYIERLYMEMGRFLAREYQENIDAWEQHIEPRLGLNRPLLQLSAVLLEQLSFAALLMLITFPVAIRATAEPDRAVAMLAQAALSVVLVILVCNQLLPFLFFNRTQGRWLARLRWLLAILFYMVVPVALLLQFFLSIAALAEPNPEARAEDESEAVDALIEAGEEEGILEESDRELIRSAVEFGDKVVREVMTPRPQLFAIPGSLTLEQFTEMLRENPYSRVPVFEGSLDHITGIVFAHDLLQITDEDARTRTVASLQRPASFVPESKKVNALLREMQMEKQHMRLVIDEYGGVAGLVTIEDLLEEIVGSITDEHEDHDLAHIVRETSGSLIVPGTLEISALEDLLNEEVEIPQDMHATTVAGLVSELAGRIPMAGEVVEQLGMRFEILASTDRRIERMRIARLPEDTKE